MRGFKYDDYHTGDNFNLILTSKDITNPDPKVYTTEIDGRDGIYDYTESLTGEVKFSNRSIKASYDATEGSRSDRVSLITTIINYLHGRKRRIIEPDDPSHYFIGRSVIKDVRHYAAYSSFTVESDCEPWRYSLEKKTVTVADLSSSAKTVTIKNCGTKTICPTIKNANAAKIVFDGNEISVASGTHYVLGVKLRSGDNVLKITGSGAMTIEYEEAIL